MQGLELAEVSKLSSEETTDANKIEVRMIDPDGTEVYAWASVSGVAGIYFFPEIGDQVLIGFLSNDRKRPVVLGSLFQKAGNKPVLSTTNYQKSIVTLRNLSLVMDDERKTIQITTPGNNSIEWNDETKSIEIKDQNGNSLKMNSDGIELNSFKSITLKSKGNISLDAVGKITINTINNFETRGMNSIHQANIAFSAQGNATAEVSASGQTEVKGAIVQIYLYGKASSTLNGYAFLSYGNTRCPCTCSTCRRSHCRTGCTYRFNWWTASSCCWRCIALCRSIRCYYNGI